MLQGIAILGSTGSIGRNALRVIEALGPEYQVVALSAHRNVELLAQQARRYKPKLVAVTNKDSAGQFRAMMDGEVQMLSGPDCLTELVQCDQVDTVLTAVVGAAGLPSVMAAAETGKRIAVANKEPLVIAGELLTRAVREHGSTLLPIDSEHSAVFQALQSGRSSEVQRILLTGSGGPFRGATVEDLQEVTLKQALSHPTWNMGPKITIDSATLMNKALEIIEAHWLFGLSSEQIDVVIHPESIVHSLVEFCDGSVIAQLAAPDMTMPIAYALGWPHRPVRKLPPLDLGALGSLSFRPIDGRFARPVELGHQVIRLGGVSGAVLNAANEAAVEAFLRQKISLGQLVPMVEEVLHDMCPAPTASGPTLEDLLTADSEARLQVRDRIILARTPGKSV